MKTPVTDALVKKTHLNAGEVVELAALCRHFEDALHQIVAGYDWSGSQCRETAVEALRHPKVR